MINNEIIRISDLRFSYDKSSKIMAPILAIDTLVVKTGERVFLQGDSGSGKTTLLGLLTGVLSTSSGNLSVLGTDFTKASNSERDFVRGTRMGYIFQMFNLIPYLSVEQNIALPCLLHPERRKRLGDRLLSDEVQRLAVALGIEVLLGQRVGTLSVGQQQRVAAARALIGRPELIIADEPTSALDHGHRERFIQLLMEECATEKISLLFVSHDPTLAKHFDRTVTMTSINRSEV